MRPLALQHARGVAVDVGVAPVLVERHDAVVDALEDAVELRACRVGQAAGGLGVGQQLRALALLQLARADVDEQGLDRRLAGLRDARARGFDLDDAPVQAQAAGLEALHVAPAFGDAEDASLGLGPLVGVAAVEHRLADQQLLVAGREQRHRGRVDVEDAAVLVQADGVGRLADERAVAGLAVFDGALCLAHGGDVEHGAAVAQVAGGGGLGLHRHAEPAQRAPGRVGADERWRQPAAIDLALQRLGRDGPVVGVQAAEEGLEAGHAGCRVEAEQGVHLVRPPTLPAAEVVIPAAQAGLALGSAQALQLAPLRRLELLARVDVGVGAQDAPVLARQRRLGDAAARQDPFPLTAVRALAEFDLVGWHTPRDIAVEGLAHAARVVRVQAFEPASVGLVKGLGLIAQHARVLGADDGFAGHEVDVVEALVGRFEGQPQPRFGFGERALHGEPARDVARDRQQAGDAVDVDDLGRDRHHALVIALAAIGGLEIAHPPGARKRRHEGGAVGGAGPDVQVHRRAADELGPAVARELAEGVVDLEVGAIGEAADDERIRAHGEGGLELVLAQRQRLRRARAVGHVAPVQHQALDGRVVQAVGAQRSQHAPTAVGVAQTVMRFDARVAGFDDLGELAATALDIVGVDPVEGALADDRRRLQAEQAARGRAGVEHDAGGVAHQGHDLGLFGQRAEAPLAVLQGLLRLAYRGDVLDRAFVAQHAARVVAQRIGVLADPDAFARAVAVDLGLEVHDLAVAFDDADELGAARRLDVPLVGDVVDGLQQLLLGVVAIEQHQRAVGAQLAAVDAGAVGAQRQALEEVRQRQRLEAIRCGHGPGGWGIPDHGEGGSWGSVGVRSASARA